MKYKEMQNIKVLASELIAYNDVVAGTVDLLLDGGVIADIKTTASLHKDAISWQLSIYNYLLNNEFTRGQVYHFDKEGTLTVVDIPLKPVEEVKRLLDCERNGEIYKQELVNVNKADLTQLYEVEALIKTFETRKKEAEEKAKELRAAIMKAMQENGLTNFENDKIRLVIKAPYERTSIDSTKLKKDMPEVAEKYTKKTTVSASLLITLKEG